MYESFFLLLLAVFCFHHLQSQDIQIGYGAGSGLAYYFEDRDETVDIDYSLPVSVFAFMSYEPEDAYFNLKLNFQYWNVGLQGRDYKTNYLINGEVSALTPSLLLEHKAKAGSWELGYNFGLGYTLESYKENLVTRQAENRENEYLSILTSAFVSLELSNKWRVLLLPSLVWQDPINSLRSSDKWYIAGEDVSFFLQLGLSYGL